MGKKAYNDSYEVSKNMFESKKVYVATSSKLENKEKNVEIISGDLVSQMRELQKEEGKHIWLFGGAGLTDPFIKANVVDEYIIGIIPIILGEGRPLFLNNNPKIELSLEEATVSEGVSLLRYILRKK